MLPRLGTAPGTRHGCVRVSGSTSVFASTPRLHAVRTQSAARQTVCHAARSSSQAFRLSTVSVREQPHAGPTAGQVAQVSGVALVLLWVFTKLRNRNRTTSRIDVQGPDGFSRARQDIFANEQIRAARQRRLQERGNEKVTMEEIDLPDNHPWATRGPAKRAAGVDSERVRAPMPRRRPPPPREPMEDTDSPVATPRSSRLRPSSAQGSSRPDADTLEDDSMEAMAAGGTRRRQAPSASSQPRSRALDSRASSIGPDDTY